MVEDWVLERLGTIKNITETAILLRNMNNHALLVTQLELLFIEVQALLDERCVENSDCYIGNLVAGNPVGYVDV